MAGKFHLFCLVLCVFSSDLLVTQVTALFSDTFGLYDRDLELVYHLGNYLAQQSPQRGYVKPLGWGRPYKSTSGGANIIYPPFINMPVITTTVLCKESGSTSASNAADVDMARSLVRAFRAGICDGLGRGRGGPQRFSSGFNNGPASPQTVLHQRDLELAYTFGRFVAMQNPSQDTQWGTRYDNPWMTDSPWNLGIPVRYSPSVPFKPRASQGEGDVVTQTFLCDEDINAFIYSQTLTPIEDNVVVARALA